MPNQFSHPWTQEELEWLKNKYPYSTKDEIVEWGKAHKRSYRAIINQASVFGIKKDNSKKRKYNPELSRKIERAQQINNVKRFYYYNKKVKIIIAGDTHIPFQDRDAIKDFLQITKQVKPDIIILNGDIIDFYEISKFSKVPFTKENLSEELEETKNLIKLILKSAPRADIFYIEGNHEFRFKKFLIENAFVFYDFFSFSLPELLELKEMGIKYIPLKANASKFSHNYVKINDFYIGHFDKALAQAGYSARWLRDTLGANIITGHTHKIGIVYRSFINMIKVGVEAGCLCRLDPPYLSNPDWQQGFIILELNQDKFQIQPVLLFL